MLDQSLAILAHEIESVRGQAEYAIFGSTALRLRGIIDREPDDIDVVVSKRVWGELLPRLGWHVDTPRAGDPPILSRPCGNELHLFYDWRDDAVVIDVNYVIETAEKVDGFRLATVEEVLRHKRAAYACLEFFPKVAKHAPDIAACERWLAREVSFDADRAGWR